MHDNVVTVIGGGLAGCEAAWQCAEQGVPVRLYEMRPVRPTPAHTTDRLAEIVCSNSFKSDEVNTAPHLLKEELRRARSLLIAVAEATRVPAGAALAIDRERFAAEVTARIAAHPRITVIREEVTRIPLDGVTIIATGPLTSDALAAEIQNLAGAEQLYFYDAIAPVVDAETINYEVVFRAARYGKGGDDYLNCPLNKEQYEAFVDALLAAECVAPKAFETDKAQYFEACLPIDVAVRRGRDTLRFGPMKPVGLCDPRTGREPYAAVQLRQENLMADSYSLVGFQNSVKWGAQKALLRMIPGLEQAEFLKFGQVHRNTYVNGPKLLTPTLQVKHEPRLFLPGRFRASKGTWNRWRRGWWRVGGRRRWCRASRCCLFRGRRPLGVCSTTWPTAKTTITNRSTSPLPCCRRWRSPKPGPIGGGRSGGRGRLRWRWQLLVSGLWRWRRGSHPPWPVRQHEENMASMVADSGLAAGRRQPVRGGPGGARAGRYPAGA